MKLWGHVAAGMLSIMVGLSVCAYLPETTIRTAAETDNDGNEYTIYTENSLTYWVYADHAVVADCEEHVASVEVPAEIGGVPVTIIGEDAFFDCYELADIVFPDSLKKIGSRAFFECYRLDTITLPVSLEELEGNPFWLAGITEYLVDENNPYYCSVDGILFSRDQKTLVRFPTSKVVETKTYDVPAGVANIAPYAFEGCYSLTEIIMHEGLETIGEHAFDDCRYVTEFVIPEGVTTIGEQAFSVCVAMERLVLPSTVTDLEDFGEYGTNTLLFNCLGKSEIREIVVAQGNPNFYTEDGVLYTADQTTLLAYPGAKTGERFVLPEGVTALKDDSFRSIRCLKTLVLPTTMEDASELPLCGFRGNIEIPESHATLSVQDNVIYNKDQTELCMYFRDLTASEDQEPEPFIVPDTVTVIGKDAFAYTYLQQITLPEHLEKIEEGAFRRTDVTDITFPESLEYIGEWAFYGSSLHTVTIPSSVETIEAMAFLDCRNLTDVCFEGAPMYRYRIFDMCHDLRSVRLLSDDFTLNASLFFYWFYEEETIRKHFMEDYSSDLTIYANSGTSAEKFAAQYDVNFKPLSEYDEPVVTLGDIDGDTIVNAVDAAAILVETSQIGAGMGGSFSEEQRSAADVDEDGEINAGDAALILQYAAFIGAGGKGTLKTYLASLTAHLHGQSVW